MIRYSSVRIFILYVIVVFFLGIPGCSTPGNKEVVSKDSEWQRLMLAGHESFKRSRFDKAAHYYQKALFQARITDNSSAIGVAAYNLAACYVRLGYYDSAKNLLKEAREEISKFQGNVTEVILVEAKVARLQEHFDESWSLTDQLLTYLSSYPSNELQLQVYLLRGHIACDQGQIVLADSEFEKSRNYSRNVSNPLLLAGYSELAGRIYLRKNRPEMAAKEFDRETGFLKEAEQYREMVLSLENAAEAYKNSGDHSLAADRFIRAARSAFAQGEKEYALELGKKSLSAANAADNEPAFSSAQRFLAEVEASPDIR